MSQLLRPKYTIAKMRSGMRRVLTLVGAWISGATPATKNSSWAAHQIDRAGAPMLKSARYHSGLRFAIQKEMTRPSSATMTVPAAGPNRSTEANTNVSETEMEAGTEG